MVSLDIVQSVAQPTPVGKLSVKLEPRLQLLLDRQYIIASWILDNYLRAQLPPGPI